MPCSLRQITDFLHSFAPLELAESWDNVGLLLGDEAASVDRVMTCLTLTSDVAEEALSQNASLIVSHHPVLFRPVQSLTTATSEGRTLLKLLRNGVAVYSPHTAFDSARLGINQLLAERLMLREIQPLRASEHPELTDTGAGRWGRLENSVPLSEFLKLVRRCLFPNRTGDGEPLLLFTGDRDRTVRTVGIGCGSAAEFLKDAAACGCDVFLTGEARFHALLEARDRQIALVQAGHYATERPGVEHLAEVLRAEFSGLEVWASELETDPLSWSID